ncbi:MAG: molybdopterin molybdotransferase MoeA [SAR202 cluster bacterium]|nr:molybdopterin molybdotransferase MoeA [SAR202 cluster bacterium]
MAEHHHHSSHREDMLSVEDALERILGYVSPLEAEERSLLEALGQTLAEDVTSPLDLPPMDNSAMDGFAVRFADTVGASATNPVELPVIGYIAAGSLPDRDLQPGTAIRIMTGAPIPPGTDAVVPFEDTDEVQRKASGAVLDRIAIMQEVTNGTNLRPAGEDLRKGDTVLHSGATLRSAEIGVLASVGRDRARVLRRPVVAVLSTGDELMLPGEAPGGGKIYDSNSFGVAAAIQRYGGIPKMLGIARDNLEDTNRKLEEGLSADLLITSAGVSKGDYDFVKDVLMQRGEIAFWSVRMRPARPLAFGALHAPDGSRVPHIGLPGNPVSALVAFEQFCRPAILKMLGQTNFAKPTVQATLREAIHNFDGRRVYARAIVTKEDGRYYATLTGPQGSNILTSMARANGLAICPENLTEMPAGATAEVQMLDWPEDTIL